VHAHPDDESITTGVTIAKYVAEGAHVTLVTCTLGEAGEILLEDVNPEQLPQVRRAELAAALAELGVDDHRYLGGVGAYNDSGMQWGPDGRAIAIESRAARALVDADLLEVAEHLVGVIRDVRPQVVVTYNPNGNYGHPDHVQAHRLTMYAVQLASVASHRGDLGEPWGVDRVFWIAEPGEPVDVLIDASGCLDQKRRAMAAHATQLTVNGDSYALSNNVVEQLTAKEAYTLAVGSAPQQSRDDLFG
jgi:N-acetyl-1-D-myo-inositol-2-amino-2-deoxy-alpha-D-glucopyranoside deacetylase